MSVDVCVMAVWVIQSQCHATPHHATSLGDVAGCGHEVRHLATGMVKLIVRLQQLIKKGVKLNSRGAREPVDKQDEADLQGER